MYSFYRWVVQVPNNVLSANKKCVEVHMRAMGLAKSTVFMYLTDRQMNNKKSKILRSTLEMPQQLVVGLAVRQAIRSKPCKSLTHSSWLWNVS
jgi:hypothetical protein